MMDMFTQVNAGAAGIGDTATGSAPSTGCIGIPYVGTWETSGSNSDPGGDRTRDLQIKSPLLYQLSYRV